jgi:hypothetical protein
MSIVIVNKTERLITIQARKKDAVVIDANSAHKMSSNVIKVHLSPGQNVIDNELYEKIKDVDYIEKLIAANYIEILGRKVSSSVKKKLEDDLEIERAKLKVAEEKLKTLQNEKKEEKKKSISVDEVSIMD